MTPDIAALKAKLESVRDDPDNRLGSRWRVIEESTVEEMLHALSRLAAPLPKDRVAQATKLIRDRLPGMLDFGQHVEVDAILVGVETLARDILALASPTAPLPAEIAGLIEQLEHPMWAHHNDGTRTLSKDDGVNDMQEAAAALRAQAQEIESQDREIEVLDERVSIQSMRIRELEAQLELLLAERHGMQDGSLLRDLKAEIERLKSDETLQSLAEQCRLECARAEKAEVERDAIRRMTIEECAKAAEEFPTHVPGTAWIMEEIAADIRALAQTDENKPKTEK